MAYFTNAITEEIEAVARVFLLTGAMAKNWNDHRRDEELRQLSGWCWVEKKGHSRRYRVGFKTRSAASRDAYYVLIEGREAPAGLEQKATPKLRIVKKAA